MFLVDTGAIDCMVSGKYLKEIGIKAGGIRNYELADGFEISINVGVAQFEFMGE